jgi:hypothetical protein
VITVGNKTIPLAEELAKLDNTEEFNKLIAASEPKSMEDMTREGLSLQEQMAADIAVMSGRIPRALATTKVGEETSEAIVNTISGIADIGTDRGVLSSESFRDLVDSSASIGVEMLVNLLEGKLDPSKGLMELGAAFKEFGSTTIDNLVLNLGEQRTEMGKSANIFATVGTGIIDKMDELLTTNFGVSLPSQTTIADQSVNKTSSSNKGENKTEEKNVTMSSNVDVTIKLDVPPGMSESDLERYLGTEDIKQRIAKIVKDTYPDMKTKDEQ